MEYSEREKGYIYAYVKYAESFRRNSLPIDWNELKELRESSGIKYSRSTELIRNAEFYGLLEPDNSLRKSKIVYDCKFAKNEDFRELEKFDEILANIYREFESLSVKAALMADEYYKISEAFLSEGIKRYNKGNKKESYVAGGIGAVIAAFGYFEEQKHLKKIEQAKQQQLEKLRNKRIEYANEHLEKINDLLLDLTPYEQKYNDRYYAIITEKIDSGNTSLVKVDKFITYLKQACRSYYNLNILSFFKAEMEAWLNGYEASDFVPLSYVEVMDLYVSEWPMLLDISDWDYYITDKITRNNKEYYLPVYSLFVDPFLFRNYVGVELPYIKNTEKGLVKRFVTGQKICSNIDSILKENIYYKKAEDLFLRIPYAPKGLSGKDYAFVLFAAIVIAILSFVIWNFTKGFVFFISSLVFCYIIGKFISSFVNSMPFVSEYNEFVETRKSLEDEEYFFAQKNNV